MGITIRVEHVIPDVKRSARRNGAVSVCRLPDAPGEQLACRETPLSATAARISLANLVIAQEQAAADRQNLMDRLTISRHPLPAVRVRQTHGNAMSAGNRNHRIEINRNLLAGLDASAWGKSHRGWLMVIIRERLTGFHALVCYWIEVPSFNKFTGWCSRIVNPDRRARTASQIDQRGFFQRNIIKPKQAGTAAPNAEIQIAAGAVLAIKGVVEFRPVLRAVRIQADIEADLFGISAVEHGNHGRTMEISRLVEKAQMILTPRLQRKLLTQTRIAGSIGNRGRVLSLMRCAAQAEAAVAGRKPIRFAVFKTAVGEATEAVLEIEPSSGAVRFKLRAHHTLRFGPVRIHPQGFV